MTENKPAALNKVRRNQELQQLGEPDASVDVLVIGGGITGAGIALDAATRGLNTVLVEKHDLAFGTSRFSSKLIHGGLRYLASLNFGIARRSAIERGIIMTRTAPHLAHAMPQLVPLLPNIPLFNKGLTRMGFLAGDALRIAAGTPASVLPFSRFLDARTTTLLSPTVDQNGLKGGMLAYDGQLIDDARLVIAVARTAAQYGAKILTRVDATEAVGNSVKLTDTLTGESFQLKARIVINASGVWAAEVDDSIKVRPSRGTHLVFDAKLFGNPKAALTVPIPGEISRFIFVMPEQLGRVYLGLTDEEAPGSIPDVPEPSEDEITFLLNTINTALGRKVTRDDVIGTFAGLRPLIDNGAGRTSDVSRDHAVLKAPSGLISVVGGKLTEYRYMAEDTLNKALEFNGVAAGNCRTKDIPLVGATEISHARRSDIELPQSLVDRFGHEAQTVVDLATCKDPLAPIADGIDVTRAEFEFAVTNEGALDAADILDRRTRIGLVASDRAKVEPFIAEFVS